MTTPNDTSASVETILLFVSELRHRPETFSRDALWLQRTEETLSRYKVLLALLESGHSLRSHFAVDKGP